LLYADLDPCTGMFPWFGFGFFFFFWLVPLGIFGLLVFLLARWLVRPSAGVSGSARAILAERYARGEITRDQFVQMTKDLQ
jgi:uncharacterized membrane protein